MEKQVKVVHEKVTNKGGDAVYALGLIGGLFYYLQSAASFPDVIIGIVKSILWPAFVIYSLLGFLNL